MIQFSKRLPALIGALLVFALAAHSVTAQTDQPTPAVTDATPVVPVTGVQATPVVTEPGTPAATQNPSALPTTMPVVRGHLNGAAIVGIPGSACWPRTDNSPFCVFMDNP